MTIVLRSCLAIRPIIVGLLMLAATEVVAQQRIRFPNPGTVNSTPLTPAPGSGGAIDPFGTPSGGNSSVVSATPWVPMNPNSPGIPGAAGGAVLGQQIQPFDPYAPQTGFGGGANMTPPNVGSPFGAPTPGFPGQTVILPPIMAPNGLPPPYNATPGGNPNVPVFPSGVPNPPPNYVPPGYVGPPPPVNGSAVTPAPVFPDGLNWSYAQGEWQRLIQDTGILYTYLYGDGGTNVEINDFEVFTSLVLKSLFQGPNFVRVTPGIGLTYLKGPVGPTVIDLPEALYSPYLNFLWQPQLTPQFGADLNFRIGLYSDLDSVTSQSLRYTGRGLGVLQLTPQVALKLGIEYFDRVDVKLLPAGGIYWEPNPQTHIDIYFPRPRIAHYWTTYGNTEWWWHIGGEYGGGSWTIDRVDNGMSQQIDLNDIRVFFGVDWNRLDRADGIFEIGYVFNREIIVKGNPMEDVDMDDTFMVRAGVKF